MINFYFSKQLCLENDFIENIKFMNKSCDSSHFSYRSILSEQELKSESDAKLIFTVSPQHDDERDDWMNLSGKRLENAYSLDEIEYSLDLIKEANPEYES